MFSRTKKLPRRKPTDAAFCDECGRWLAPTEPRQIVDGYAICQECDEESEKKDK